MSDHINHLLSDWLDDADARSINQDDVSTNDASQSIAESLVVHGLLTDLGRCDDDHQAEQIRGVMQRIDSESESDAVPAAAARSLNTGSRLAIVTSALAIAAAVIVMFVVLGPQQRVSAAMASLERVGYDVELTDSKEVAADETLLSQLTCVRKLADVRGIKQVELWFDPKNGTVHKMLLDGLPRGRGGPETVTLELIDQSELGAEFFSHESHHEPDRRVKSE